MKTNILRTVSLSVLVAITFSLTSQKANAKYPVTHYQVASPGASYTTLRPEVVGYQHQRRGVLGRRSELQPVVAPVARTMVAPLVTVPKVRPAAPLTPVTPMTQLRPIAPDSATRYTTACLYYYSN